jgi:antitoxin (DNA-binding transcriptional repressor) of toxin-antitoxin stability system
MRSVAIEQLKDRLGEYVRLAAAGETVLVTDRDRVVAELGPPRAARPRTAEEEDAIIQDWVRRGIATAPTLPRGTRPGGIRAIPHEQLMADLARDREDRI